MAQQPGLPHEKHQLRERYPRASAFVSRRLAPDHPLGRYLTVGLLLGLLALGVFGIIAENMVRQTSLVTFDETFDENLRQSPLVTPRADIVFHTFTRLGSSQAMAILASLAAVVLFWRGHRLLALGIFLTAVTGGLLDLGLKDLFQRPRPPLPNLVIKERNWGFPSGHSMGSMIGYGLLAYLLVLFQLHRRWTRVAAITVLTLLVLLIGFSRIYLHAHYFSDVLAGFAAGAVWLAVCISCIEMIRRRPRAQKASPLQTPPGSELARAGSTASPEGQRSPPSSAGA
jgi:membrane-associated phospholipid phosphatase